MRGILWLAIVLGVLWAAYWFVGAITIERQIGQLFHDRASSGLTAANDGVAVAGFPSRFDLTVTKPRLADPQSGWGWSAPFAQVLSMTWKPWHVIAMLPPDQEIDAPGQRIALTTTRMAASLRLQPSADLTFEELVVEGHDLLAGSDLGWKIGARSAVLALARDATEPFAQRLGIDVADLRPDPGLAHRLPALGEVISSLHLDARVSLTAALDRHSAITRPSVSGLSLRDFQVRWGALVVSAKGDVTVGPGGAAQGQIDMRIEGWRQIPVLGVALGLIRPEMGESVTRAMEVLANSGADPEVLTLPLTFKDGWAALGALPLGPAPVF